MKTIIEFLQVYAGIGIMIVFIFISVFAVNFFFSLDMGVIKFVANNWKPIIGTYIIGCFIISLLVLD